MEPNDPTWDETGFDDDDGGFLSPDDGQKMEPESKPASSDAVSETAEPARRMVEALPPLPPPSEPQRRRSAIFWVALGLAALFLIAVIGGGFFFLLTPSVEEQAFTVLETEQTAPPAPVKPPVPVADSLVHQDSVVVDTIAAPEPLFAEAAPTPTPTLSAPKPRVAPEPRAESQPRLPTVPETTPAPTTKAGAMWVVQVFSSPSRDDADEWLQALRERNIRDGYIVEQQLKGQPWYRVRFGQFSTREEAEQAAVQNGFRQPWIARVR